jgi:hypothetical protein
MGCSELSLGILGLKLFSLAGQWICKSILPVSRSCLGFVADDLYSIATELCRFPLRQDMHFLVWSGAQR